MKQNKNSAFICCLQETPFRCKNTHKPKMSGWKDISMKMETTRKLG